MQLIIVVHGLKNPVLYIYFEVGNAVRVKTCTMVSSWCWSMSESLCTMSLMDLCVVLVTNCWVLSLIYADW